MTEQEHFEPTFEIRQSPHAPEQHYLVRTQKDFPQPYLVAQLTDAQLQQLHEVTRIELTKKILETLPDIAPLKAAIAAAQQRTHEVAGDPDAIRMDLQDAVMDELKSWRQYAEGLEAYLETAGRALRGEYSSGAVPVPLNTLTYAATALEGSADNGDRYAARQIRTAIAKHPTPEAYS